MAAPVALRAGRDALLEESGLRLLRFVLFSADDLETYESALATL
jgi:hypothetical protein